MGDIADILKDRDFSEPAELMAIKKYIHEKFQADVSLALRDDAIIITASNGSLANTLRLHSQQIIKNCQVTKKLVFRIG
jgi:hypothetical protein